MSSEWNAIKFKLRNALGALNQETVFCKWLCSKFETAEQDVKSFYDV